MCSFEMRHMKPLWKEYSESWQLEIQRPGFVNQDLCGFYNNWFILDMSLIFQPDVQDWLQWMDGTGYIYRKRVNDLIVHVTAAVSMRFYLPPRSTAFWVSLINTQALEMSSVVCYCWRVCQRTRARDDHAIVYHMRLRFSPSNVLDPAKGNPTSRA